MTVASDAMALSVAVSTRLRQLAGKGDVLDLRPSLRRLFDTEEERTEAARLLDLAELVRRKKATALDGGLFEVEQDETNLQP